ncbi:CubicO group peptidase (beta-lactamase class C family) [Kribbella sp. VKM Ac-2527]|uniref:CubicO group peptidase (Beta-lactamase class C family) n=1 Tax=Kribbella caucasensis TaxID=2512215 RepID=A0A4R6KCK5_9ACTN|nr:serine hydrolase domain-containing protein [Kribbella sp. VKM Ac-2527]TDO47778.1 CubicO group peptidase (beta-lactamase class C family) [Kribbella sp. VKM Ac-2527]
MGAGLRGSVEDGLWPLVEAFVGSHEVAGLAVALVRDEEVVSRGFGVRDVGTGAPVTPETMFHLASVSKPFVATAIVSLATARDGGEPVLDLDAPITERVPEFTLADGRAGEVTARRLLSHTSGLPDVADYGWHDPQLGDDALSEFARSLSDWRLQAEPGSAFSYSNAGYELLGLLLSRATDTTFEKAMRQQVLAPLGMRNSTFLRGEVPAHLAASPHVGMPLSVPEGAYPYTRRHAPSSTLHSNLVEMCRWMVAHFEPAEVAAGGSDGQWARLDAGLLDLMWQPVVPVGHPPWQDAATLGWAMGSYRGHRTLSHSGADPGFGSRVVLVPERRTGVVILANSNTVPASPIAAAALDIALADVPLSVISGATPGELGEGVVAMRALVPPVVGPVAEALTTSGPDAAKAVYHRLAAVEPAEFDLDDEGFVDATWGAIELHRPSLVWPLLRVWTELRPDSSVAWTMTGCAHQLDGQLNLARTALRRALDLDPENDDAAQVLSRLPSA